MEPGTLLFTLLSQAPGVVALLGTRIYPILAPQPTPYPYLTYQVISQNGDETMSCALDDNARVQLSIFAATYAETCAISAATRATLAGYRDGQVLIDFDGNRDQPSNPSVCYFRTQDYLLELPAP